MPRHGHGISPSVLDELDEETRIICECGHALSRHFGTSFDCLDCRCIDFKERSVKTRLERIQEDLDGPPTLADVVSGRRKLP